MATRFFLKLQLWFNWHFTWDEFMSTDGLVSTVVSILLEIAWWSYCPVSLLHYSKGTHFSIHLTNPLSHRFSSHLEGSKLTSSQTLVENILSKAESYKIQYGVIGNVLQRNFAWKLTHALHWSIRRVCVGQSYSSNQTTIVFVYEILRLWNLVNR